MAPPKDADPATSEAIRTLISLIVSSDAFNPDFNVVATDIGISHAKNVPRKIDSILKPFGYKMTRKEIVKIGEEAPTTPAKSTAKTKAKPEPKTPGGTEDEDEEEMSPTPAKKKTPAAKKAAAATKEKKTPAKKAPGTPKRSAKKRKIEEVVDDESEGGDAETADETVEANVSKARDPAMLDVGNGEEGTLGGKGKDIEMIGEEDEVDYD